MRRKELEEKEALREERMKKTEECLHCVEAIEEFYNKGMGSPMALLGGDDADFSLVEKPEQRKNRSSTPAINDSWLMECNNCGQGWCCVMEESGLFPKYEWYRGKPGKEVDAAAPPSFSQWLVKIGLEVPRSVFLVEQRKKKVEEEKQTRRAERQKKTKSCLACIEAIEDFFVKGLPSPVDAEFSKDLKLLDGPEHPTLGAIPLNTVWNLQCVVCNTVWSCIFEDSTLFPKYVWYKGRGQEPDKVNFNQVMKQLGIDQ